MAFGLLLFTWISTSSAEGVLVRYRQETSLSALSLSPKSTVVRWETGPGESQQLADSLNADPDVAFAEPDYKIDFSSLPNDPLFSHEPFTNYEISHIFEAWDVSSHCDGVVIAVLDTGVDTQHPDLQENLWRNTEEIAGNGKDDDGDSYIDDSDGYNFADDNGDVTDNAGHGTAMAGIIGAVGGNSVGMSGVCQKARIMPLKIVDNGSTDTSNAIRAIDYAVDHGARIINMSWGIAGGERSAFLEEAIGRALDKGAVVVVASGNKGVNLSVDPVYPAASPLANIITVGAHDDNGRLASFSNYGSGIIDVLAPGVDILTTRTKGGYFHETGTSAAAAHVSGVAALLLSNNTQLTPVQISNILSETARADSSSSSALSSSGVSGIMDAFQAVSSAQEVVPHVKTFETQAAGGCSLILQ